MTTSVTAPRLFDPGRFGRFVSPPLARRRADRRRVHPPHPAKLDLRAPHPDDAPWWYEHDRIEADGLVIPIMVYTSRKPPAQDGLDVLYDPRDGTYSAVRFGSPRPAA